MEAWLEGQDSRFKRKVLKIFEGAGVDRRYAIMDAHEVFLNTSFEERNDIYVREMKNLGKQAFQKALLKSNWEANSIDFLITVLVNRPFDCTF